MKWSKSRKLLKFPVLWSLHQLFLQILRFDLTTVADLDFYFFHFSFNSFIFISDYSELCPYADYIPFPSNIRFLHVFSNIRLPGWYQLFPPTFELSAGQLSPWKTKQDIAVSARVLPSLSFAKQYHFSFFFICSFYNQVPSFFIIHAHLHNPWLAH